MTTQTTDLPRTTSRHSLVFIAVTLAFVLGLIIAATVFLERSERKSLEGDALRTLSEAIQNRAASTSQRLGAVENRINEIASLDMVRLFAVESARSAPADGASRPARRGPADDLALRLPEMRALIQSLSEHSGLASVCFLTPALDISLHTAPARTLSSLERQAAADVLKSGLQRMLPAQRDAAGTLLLTFLTPVFPPQYLADAGKGPRAVMLSQNPLAALLAPADDRPGPFGVRTRLLQTQGDAVSELTADGPRALTGWPAHPGDGQSLRRGALPNGEAMLMLVRPLPGLPLQIGAAMPARQMEERYQAYTRALYAGAGCVALLALVLLPLAWWLLMGRRTRSTARELDTLYATVNHQQQLLNGINDALADGLVLTSADSTLRYVNQSFAEMAGNDAAALLGRSAREALPPVLAQSVLHHTRQTLQKGAISTFIEPMGVGEAGRIWHISCSPFHPAQGGTEVVSVYRDITDNVREHERAQKAVTSTVNVLVRAVEAVDPYLHGHSHFMGLLATALARRLGLDAQHEATVRIAANLSQIGMIQLPRKLCTKQGVLTPEEREDMHRHILFARDALEGIDFDFPVLPALLEMHERLDGSGYPNRLRGDTISLDARILAVANTFCAVMRPRSYRNAHSLDEALDILSVVPPQYDPAVVEALRGWLNDAEGAAFLAELTRPGK